MPNSGAAQYSRRDAVKLGAVVATGTALAGLTGPATATTESTRLATITPQGESLVANNAQDGAVRLNGRSFQQDALVTHNGWQYTAFYTDAGGGVRHVAVARRELPSPNWEVLELSDYEQVTDDAHNTISIGVGAVDGTLHLSFDHHTSVLHYRKSVVGLLTDPTSHTWNADEWGPIRKNLVGPEITRVTYPRFVTTPQGRLLFSMRIGLARDGAEHLYEYRGEGTGGWAERGVYISGSGDASAYLNGLTYGPGGRLHATWVWRLEGGADTNHDLIYAYSDDHGQTWHRNDGASVATPITPSTPGVRVWTIPQGSNLSNSEGQAVDGLGRPHVISRDNLEGSLQIIHYYRGIDGVWRRRATGLTPSGRGKIIAPSGVGGDLFALSGRLRILGATSASAYTDWHVVDNSEHGRFEGEPLFDRNRLAEESILSVFYQEVDSPELYVLDYALA